MVVSLAFSKSKCEWPVEVSTSISVLVSKYSVDKKEFSVENAQELIWSIFTEGSVSKVAGGSVETLTVVVVGVVGVVFIVTVP